MPESFVISKGVNIWTVRTGKGYPVMLCNGGAGCCDYLEPVAEMLDDMAQVIRFEQRGCGRSQLAPPYDIEICLTDLESLRNHYKIDRFVIGGHSWGADLALFYALEHTENVAGLICIAGGRIHNDREWHAEYERRKELEGEQVPLWVNSHNCRGIRLIRTIISATISFLSKIRLFAGHNAQNTVRHIFTRESKICAYSFD